MAWRNLLVVVIALLIVSGLRLADVRAEGQCVKLLDEVCMECHNNDKYCDTLGGTEKKWEALIDWMIANGAELDDGQIKLLVNCLSEPYEEAKKACGK